MFKKIFQAFADTMDGFREHNVLPIAAGVCVLAVLATTMASALMHTPTNSHPNRK